MRTSRRSTLPPVGTECQQEVLFGSSVSAREHGWAFDPRANHVACGAHGDALGNTWGRPASSPGGPRRCSTPIAPTAFRAVSEDGLVDITILGAGPVGLSAAYYAGPSRRDRADRRGLEQLGGQVAATYPEKHVYDVAGHPKILGQTLVDLCVEQGLQYGAEVILGEEAKSLERLSQRRRGHLRADDRDGRAVPVARDDRDRRATARSSRAGSASRGSTSGAGAACTTSSAQKAQFSGQALRDRRRRRLRRSTGRSASRTPPIAPIVLVHRRDRFRRARDVDQRGDARSRIGGRGPDPDARTRCARCTATARSRRSRSRTPKTGEVERSTARR